MPKSYTDDIAAALPSALTGPFLVVDPAESSSYLKLDPGAARLEAAGTARPWRSLLMPLARNYGVVGSVTIGDALDARRFVTHQTTGIYLAPCPIPQDMDLTEPASVKVLLAPYADGGGGEVVRLEVICTYGKDGDLSVANQTVTCDWTTPAGWTTEDLKLVTIDGGSGHTFAGGTFEGADWLGLRVCRAGDAVQDALSVDLLLAASVSFEYRAREL